MENLYDRLVSKSIEAFIMGLEIYNKPTIKYRIEGFSFFICNAWELMLKAHLINKEGEQSIYFSNKPNRTLSLENVVKQIFPDKHGNLRKNLLQIIELRNTSTHFITEDYEHIYAPLFQACVANYMSKMQEFHAEDITQHISQNFLTLSVRIDQLNEEEIRAKYSSSMAERLLSETKKITAAVETNNSDFAIPVITKYYITKNKKDADLKMNIDKSSNINGNILREIKDPNDLFPLTTKELVKIVNKRLKTRDILLTKRTKEEEKLTVFTTNDLKLFNDFYGIKTNESYCFHYKLSNRYGYSHKLCDFIFEEILKDPKNFVQNLKKGIKKIR